MGDTPDTTTSDNTSTTDTTTTDAPINPRTGKPLSMTPEAIAQREYRARKRAEREAQGNTETPAKTTAKTPAKRPTKSTGTTAADKRIAELERQLEQAKAEAQAAKTTMWSARIPVTLRNRVRLLQEEQSVQAVTVEALTMWAEAKENES